MLIKLIYHIICKCIAILLNHCDSCYLGVTFRQSKYTNMHGRSLETAICYKY